MECERLSRFDIRDESLLILSEGLRREIGLDRTSGDPDVTLKALAHANAL